MIETLAAGVCELEGCEAPISQPPGGGRRRRYCSDAHRAEARRRRLAAGGAADAPSSGTGDLATVITGLEALVDELHRYRQSAGSLDPAYQRAVISAARAEATAELLAAQHEAAEAARHAAGALSELAEERQARAAERLRLEGLLADADQRSIVATVETETIRNALGAAEKRFGRDLRQRDERVESLANAHAAEVAVLRRSLDQARAAAAAAEARVAQLGEQLAALSQARAQAETQVAAAVRDAAAAADGATAAEERCGLATQRAETAERRCELATQQARTADAARREAQAERDAAVTRAGRAEARLAALAIRRPDPDAGGGARHRTDRRWPPLGPRPRRQQPR